VLTLQYAQAMIIPIVMGVLLSYALEPAVAWMERRRIPRAVAAAVVLIAPIASCGGSSTASDQKPTPWSSDCRMPPGACDG
jgi:predicted PurR-regulated permease PerM